MGMTLKLAVPTMGAAGPESTRSQHFGRCDCFTLFDIVDGEIKGWSCIDNPPHEEGGCLRPVKLLADAGANAIVCIGMGGRPFMGFMQAGIAVLSDGFEPNVGKIAQMVAEGKVQPMNPGNVCNHHH